MATEKSPSFKTIPAGTSVTWHYRSAIGHGTVTGVHKLGKKCSQMTDNSAVIDASADHEEARAAVKAHRRLRRRIAVRCAVHADGADGGITLFRGYSSGG